MHSSEVSPGLCPHAIAQLLCFSLLDLKPLLIFWQLKTEVTKQQCQLKPAVLCRSLGPREVASTTFTYYSAIQVSAPGLEIQKGPGSFTVCVNFSISHHAIKDTEFSWAWLEKEHYETQSLAQLLVWAADSLVMSVEVPETRNRCRNFCTSLQEQVAACSGNVE